MSATVLEKLTTKTGWFQDRLIEQLKRHEGYRGEPYQCSEGVLTIGYGMTLDRLAGLMPEVASWLREGGGSVAEAEAAKWLREEVVERRALLVGALCDEYQTDWPGFAHLAARTERGPARWAVLQNMAYQLGITGVLGFKRMLAGIAAGHFDVAAAEMLNSLWARQTSNRAHELAYQMRTGCWVDPDHLRRVNSSEVCRSASICSSAIFVQR
jgi:lysozyme